MVRRTLVSSIAKSRTQRARTAGAMSLPSILLMFAVSMFPFISGLVYSLQDYSLMRPRQRNWVWLQNFSNLATSDREFRGVLTYTFLYAGLVVLVSYVLGMLLALLLNRDIRFRGLFRALALVPWLIPPAIASVSWSWILNDQFGYINVVLTRVGLIKQPILFLALPHIARITVILTSAWKSYPFMMIVLLAGMQTIPNELYEVASIDGAGFLRSFWHITLPMLRSVTVLSIVLMFIWTFNNFENIYLLTRGGPAESTFVLAILSYYTAFYRYKISYACAISTLMLFVLLGLVFLYMRASRLIKPEDL